MKFQIRYLLYILTLHAVLVVLLFVELRQAKPLFAPKEVLLISVELLFIGSLYIAFRIYRVFRQPSEFIASGIEAIRDKDFTVKFVPTGNNNVDELIRVYNLMIDQLRQERTRQAEQQFFLDKLVEAAPIAVLVFDFDNRISAVNPKAQQILKCPASELAGKTLTVISHPLLSQLTSILPDQPQIIRLSGVETYRVLRGQFIDRGFGRQFLFIEELTTEIIETEKKAYGKVIRMMAHEVNNSIGAVNSIMAIAEPDVADPDVRKAVRVAIERNDRLNGFMRRFADVVRLPSPAPARTDLTELVYDVVRLMQPQADRQQVRLQSDTPTEPVLKVIDRAQLEQVLVNLVKNALEACQPGQFVELILRPHELLVRDNGQPISGDVAANLFNPFFSTKSTGQGIGLTLTRDILLNHGLTFSLQTNADGWTVFRIEWPR